MPRSLGPSIGVVVKSVAVDGHPAAGHPLVGAAVDLLDDPVFDGRNGLSAVAGKEPIVPFHLRVAGGGVVLDRRASPAAARVTPAMEQAPPALLARLGRDDPRAFRQQRAAQLRQALQSASGETERQALAKRLESFGPTGPAIATGIIRAALRYKIALDEEPSVSDPSSVLAPPPSSAPWSVDLWIGAWDADALCAYVVLGLSIPQAT